jgi:hypothetical protein
MQTEVRSTDREAGKLFVHEAKAFPLEDFPEWIEDAVEIYDDKRYTWTHARYEALRRGGYSESQRREILSDAWTDEFPYERVELAIEEGEGDPRRWGFNQLNSKFIPIEYTDIPIEIDLDIEYVNGVVFDRDFDTDWVWKLDMDLNIRGDEYNPYDFEITVRDQFRTRPNEISMATSIFDPETKDLIYADQGWGESPIPYDRSTEWRYVIAGFIKKCAKDNFIKINQMKNNVQEVEGVNQR